MSKKSELEQNIVGVGLPFVECAAILALLQQCLEDDVIPDEEMKRHIKSGTERMNIALTNGAWN